MDEAEKYQQRLQAIAEKRRLQEEQDRAKRQLEDEKLRLQQLKRKSLRDQWLMEGPPLSPDGTGPRSPLWGTQAQQIEAHIDKLQNEIVEKTPKHKKEGSISLESHTDHHGNGERVKAVTPPPSGSSTAEEDKRTDQSNETSLTNGTTSDEKSHNAPPQHVTNINKGAETFLFLGYTEAEPGQGLCDEDEVSAVIHAERVIVISEGEKVTEKHKDTDAKTEKLDEKIRDEEKEGVRETAKEEKGEREQVEAHEEEQEEKLEGKHMKEQEEQLENDQQQEQQEERWEDLSKDGDGKLQKDGEEEHEKDGEEQENDGEEQEKNGEGKLEKDGQEEQEKDGEQQEEDAVEKLQKDGEEEQEKHGKEEKEEDGEEEEQEKDGDEQEKNGEGKLEKDGEEEKENDGKEEKEEDGEEEEEEDGEEEQEKEVEGKLKKDGEEVQEKDGEGKLQKDGEEEQRKECGSVVENHLEMFTDPGDITEEGKLNLDVTSSNQDNRVKIITHPDEETSADTDADAAEKPVKDPKTSESALNTDLPAKADPLPVTEQEAAEIRPQSLSQSTEGALQIPCSSSTPPASAENPNGAQKSPGLPSSPTNTAAAHFQEIPLGGATMEEEPLLATKMSAPLTDPTSPSQTEEPKTKTCQCCTVM